MKYSLMIVPLALLFFWVFQSNRIVSTVPVPHVSNLDAPLRYQVAVTGAPSVTGASQRLDPVKYGAAGDGKKDDTAAIQSAIKALGKGGILDGMNRTYQVSKLHLKSDMTLLNFKFLTKPGSEKGRYYSPVTIGDYGDKSTYRNITIRNVHIDGNRRHQKNLIEQEDGGRHGFRLIGHIENVLIENSSATRCASDGLCIYQGLRTRRPEEAALDTALIRNVLVRNSRFTWNRRHGASLESVENVRFEDCDFDHNGHDIEGGSTEGSKGAKFGGHLYGNGVDIEGYGIGSYVGSLTFLRCQALQNVRGGIYFFDVTDPRHKNFRTRNRLVLDRCIVDAGTRHDLSDGYALSFSSLIDHKARGDVYRNVIIRDSEIRGGINLRAVTETEVIGGEIAGHGNYLGNLDHAKKIKIQGTRRGRKKFYPENSPNASYLESSRP